MKLRILLAAGLALLSGVAQAATIDLTSMTVNGDASASGGSVVLTPAATSKAGSAFVGTAFSLSPTTVFSASFGFTIGSPGGGGADGLAFVIQNSAGGATALGGAGGGIGYSGLSDSIIVEFDTWNNGPSDDFSGNHVGINTNGNLDSIVQADPGFSLDDVTATAWIDYDGTTLSVFTSTGAIKPGSALISTAIDLDGIVGSHGFFGFSAATGGASAEHTITSFDLEVSAVPLPAGLPLLGAGLAMFGALRLRRKS